MNNLLKILISLFVTVSLNADQGMYNFTVSTSVTPSGGFNVNDVAVNDSNVYVILNTAVYRYDLALGSMTNSAVGSTNKKIKLSNLKLFILDDNNLYIRNLADINTTVGTYSGTSFNSMAISSDGDYVFIGSTTGVSVVRVSDATKVAFVASMDSTDVLDLVVKENTLYAASLSGLKVLNISNPLLISLDSTIDGTFYKLAIENDYLYTLSSNGLSAYDISSPSAPSILATVNTLGITPSKDTSLAVGDTYAYIGDTAGTDIFDVSNKLNMTKESTDTNNIAKSIAILGELTYWTVGEYLTKHTATTDYPNDLSSGANSATKTIAQLDIDSGVFGELGSALDIDIIELNLPSGRFKSTITGMSDLNVSLYSALTDTSLIVSVQSNTNTLEINAEVVAGLRYLKVQSMTGATGEYKITAVTGGDDWTDNMSAASLVNMGETIKGNIIDSNDVDYLRVDTTSKGILSFTSTTSDVLSIVIKNSYNDDNMTYTGSLATIQLFDIPSAGTYYIKATGISSDVEDKDYSFRVDFSKSATLEKEDDAPFSLKEIFDINKTNISYEKLSINGDFIYISEGLVLRAIDRATFTDLSGYDAVISTITDYKIVGEYVYVLYATGMKIFAKGGGQLSSIDGNFFSGEHLEINGNYAYVSEIDSNTIYVVDISDKQNPSLSTTVDVGSSVRAFDVKTSFIDGVQRTYLYLATQSGLRIYDFTDPSTSTLVQIFRENQHMTDIVISNPYAYLSHDSDGNGIGDQFMIIYVKRPTSSPKFKGVLNIDAIKDIVINQDFAYLITNTNASQPEDKYLKVVDIRDQTAPKLIDTSVISGQNKYQYARSIAVSDGLGYIVEQDTATYKIVKYDMSKDYSDIKNYAKKFNFDEKIYGAISKHRNDDIDMFYLSINSTAKLDFVLNSDINMTYEIHNFNDDSNVTSFDAPASVETTPTTNLKAGEYYISVHSTGFLDNGSYEFSINKVDDDYTDTFTDATLVSITNVYEADMLIGDDVDIVKIEVTQRGTLTLKTTGVNVNSNLYYEDAHSLIQSDVNGVLSVKLNPGIYYIKMQANGTAGAYTFETSFVESNEFSMTDGFDDIGNFGSKYVVYGERYIYSIGVDNQLSIFNHLLQRVEKTPIISDKDIQNNCGQLFFDNRNISINLAELDAATGEYTCGHGYLIIQIESDSDEYKPLYIPGDNIVSNDFSASASDIAVVGLDDGYAYEYSKINSQIYKVKISEMSPFGNNAYSVLPSTATVDEIKSIKTDGNIDFVATNNLLSIYLSDPTKNHYDANNTYIGNITNSRFFTLDGDIETMHLDRVARELYVLDKNSTTIKVIKYTSTIDASMTSIDLGEKPNGFYVKDDKVYISFSTYGVKVYSYPLTATPTIIHDIPNIGADISAPFTYDGSTFNYLSNGNPQLFLLGDSFKDGVTAGTYSVIEEVKEGEGGFEGCFIATAAYGNYFTPNVKVLRDFRDDYLLQNEFGRVLVDFYYRHSPSIASDISKSEFAKATVRVVLTPIVYIIKYPLAFLLMLMLLVFSISARKYLTSRKVVAL